MNYLVFKIYLVNCLRVSSNGRIFGIKKISLISLIYIKIYLYIYIDGIGHSGELHYEGFFLFIR
jgi:hypothetical protein